MTSIQKCVRTLEKDFMLRCFAPGLIAGKGQFLYIYLRDLSGMLACTAAYDQAIAYQKQCSAPRTVAKTVAQVANVSNQFFLVLLFFGAACHLWMQ